MAEVSARILVGGPDRRILVNGIVRRFEDHPQLGPCPQTKTGRELDLRRVPQAFWDAVQRWYDTGKRVDENGLCVWEPEPVPDHTDFVRVGRNLFPRATWERICKERHGG